MRRYLKARQEFFGIFGTGSRDFPDSGLLDGITHAEQAAKALGGELMARREFFLNRVLPPLAELLRLEPERLRELEHRIERFAALIPTQVTNLPLGELRDRLAASLSALNEIEQSLIELREQLGG